MKPCHQKGTRRLAELGHRGQDRVMEEEEMEVEEEGGRGDLYVRRGGSGRGKYETVQHRSLSMDF